MTASHSLSNMRAANNMPLTAITKGKLEKPPRILLYGVEKIGKSTFAASAPSPVFICSEDGTSELDVARFPEPKHWEEVRYAIDSLVRNEHTYRTLVIDTLDWLEPLCWNNVCRRGGVTNIEDWGGGYSKGFGAALDEWRSLTDDLDELRHKKGMGIILLAHSWIKSFKNPEGDDYDRYELKLHNKASALFKEWSDVVLFATFETFAAKTKGGQKAKGVSTGARVIRTSRTAAYDAGNRYDLPDPMPLDYGVFAEAVKMRQPAEPPVLRERIGKLLEEAGDQELHKRVTTAVSAAGDDAPKLAKIHNTLAAMVEAKRKAG